MVVTVGMYDASLAHIGERLNGLGLNLNVLPFDKTGHFLVNGVEITPAEVDVDYLWLSSHINADGAQKVAFDLALACKSIGVLQTFNAGLDNPAYKKISLKGTRICNSSAQGVAIAEYVMAQVLSITHPVAQQRDQQTAKEWKITPFRELSRTHWLIVGYGPIGREVAKRAKAFGAGISVVRRSPKTSAIVDKAGTIADLGTLLPEADIIVFACPLNEKTRGFASIDFFKAVKPGAILVNIARGGLIDDASMIEALDDGLLETAVLDVFHTEPLPIDDPLWSHPKIRLTPHTSFAGNGGQERWDQLFLDNLVRFTKAEALTQEVDPTDIA
jgi:phosphoglycerate dehydrogenase-like enzyme